MFTKKIKIFIIILVTLSACSLENQPIQDQQKEVEVHYENGISYSSSIIEYSLVTVIYTLESGMESSFPDGMIKQKLEESSKPLTIKFKNPQTGKAGSCANTNDPQRRCTGFQCSASPTGWCKGLYEPNKFKITVVYDKCIGRTALAHELIHAFSHIVTNDYDPNHENRDYFSSPNSLESEAQNSIAQNLCQAIPNEDENNIEEEKNKNEEKDKDKNGDNNSDKVEDDDEDLNKDDNNNSDGIKDEDEDDDNNDNEEPDKCEHYNRDGITSGYDYNESEREWDLVNGDSVCKEGITEDSTNDREEHIEIPDDSTRNPINIFLHRDE